MNYLWCYVDLIFLLSCSLLMKSLLFLHIEVSMLLQGSFIWFIPLQGYSFNLSIFKNYLFKWYLFRAICSICASSRTICSIYTSLRTINFLILDWSIMLWPLQEHQIFYMFFFVFSSSKEVHPLSRHVYYALSIFWNSFFVIIATCSIKTLFFASIILPHFKCVSTLC